MKLANGDVYRTGAGGGAWADKPDGSKRFLGVICELPTLAVSPDGKWLAVINARSHVGYSYRIELDGSIDAWQKFYWLHTPDDADDCDAVAACFDRAGRLYVATRLGVQVLDRNGRSRLIMPVPGGAVSGLCFGGKAMNTLYAVSGNKLYRRHMNAVGWAAFQPPIELPPWAAG